MSASVSPTAKRVLVLWWYPKGSELRPAIRHHLHVLDSSPRRHQLLYHNIEHGIPACLRQLQFDVIILHTTLLTLRWASSSHEKKWQLRWLKDVKALKIALPQDEYDHSEILDEWLLELGVSVVGTNFDERVRPLLYPLSSCRCRFLRCLTGYIDERTAGALSNHLLPAAERHLDIVYRAAHLPYWFGSQGQLKHQIADRVASQAAALGLRCDISTDPRQTITSDDWFGFLAAARATIGCESGSSVLDRRGEIQAMVCWLQQKHPEMTFTEASRELPRGWDDYRFFALGPRHLEAVVTRTCQVLIEGRYDGVLQPHRHYIPLRRDLANLDEVLHMVRDHQLVDAVTARAYEEIYQSGSYGYRAFAERIDATIPQESQPRWHVQPWWLVRLSVWVGLLRIHAGRTLSLACRWLLTLPPPGQAEASLYYGPEGLLRALLHSWKIAGYLLWPSLFRIALGHAWLRGFGRAVARDLLKLTVIRRMVARPGRRAFAFTIQLVLSSETIRFVSWPRGEWTAGTDEKWDWSALRENLAAGQIHQIEWDHSRIKTPVRFAQGFVRAGDLWLPPGAMHHLEGLLALARDNVELVLALLQYAVAASGDSGMIGQCPPGEWGTEANAMASAEGAHR